MPGNDQLLHVHLLFPAHSQDVSNATVYLRLEGVDRIDAPSRVIAEQVFHGGAYQPGLPLQLEIPGTIPPDGSRYHVRIHVDVDGDGTVSAGDYVSTESYPVNPSAPPRQLQIRVHRV